MTIAPRLDPRQTPSLAMTPRLHRSVKLLQLSNVDLAAYVEEELERNPLLERDRIEEAEPPVAASPEREPARTERNDGDRRDGARNADLDAAGSMPWGAAHGAAAVDAPDGVERTAAGRVSLHDHVARQIRIAFDGRDERSIAVHLLGSLDDAGYLTTTIADASDRLGRGAVACERVLARLQRLDPPGIFARDLKECLGLQLRDLNRLDPVSGAVLDNLELVAKRDVAALRKIRGCSDRDILDVLGELKALDPKPGLRFEAGPVQAVVPDVVVRTGAAGGWNVELDAERLPRVLANGRYFAEVRGGARSDADKTFVAERWAEANWLVGALDRRARTILRVAREIVRRQDMFLTRGARHLKPLALRDIADALGLHESTVSRATSNKFVLTPRGVFELRYFFAAALDDTGGGPAHSAEAVRHRIKALVEDEPPAKALSDGDIARALRGDGVGIARRTVAKYREAMRIPSSVRRRREARRIGASRP